MIKLVLNAATQITYGKFAFTLSQSVITLINEPLTHQPSRHAPAGTYEMTEREEAPPEDGVGE